MPSPDLIERRPPSEPCLLSVGQERLWFLEQLEGPSATYNVCTATRLRGGLRFQCLEQAVNEIVRRHESLRTTFPVVALNEPPTQLIGEPSSLRLEVVDPPPNPRHGEKAQ